MSRDALWLVEYIPNKDCYRISRFSEPDQTVAYEDDWTTAVRDIVGNYGYAVRVILIRTANGTTECRTYNFI